MQDRTKNILITLSFVFVLILIFIINIIAKDKQISITERRKLASFPKITIQKLINGNIADDFEKYATDQFIGRDFFRSIKSIFNFNVYMQKDNNDLFEQNGAIYKMEYPLNENNISKSADRINYVYENYLKDMKVYYAIIPDKNYYLETNDYLKIDYNKLKEIMKNKLNTMKYIDIWNHLGLEDYYKTDLHWKQENLQKVTNIIKNNMNLEIKENNYVIKDRGDFYGTYYGQLASTQLKPDRIYTLTNSTIENCTVYNYETQKTHKVYEETNSSDKYDIYLLGATPLISIENPNANTDKELLLFRDSFGSSIAPLFIENYKKITLVDLRYISSNQLKEYIEFEDQDVLFLYSTLILNQNVLK